METIHINNFHFKDVNEKGKEEELMAREKWSEEMEESNEKIKWNGWL